MRRRMGRVETLAEELFVLTTLGDERATVATYVAGRRAYDRAQTSRRPLPARVEQGRIAGAQPSAGASQQQ